MQTNATQVLHKVWITIECKCMHTNACACVRIQFYTQNINTFLARYLLNKFLTTVVCIKCVIDSEDEAVKYMLHFCLYYSPYFCSSSMNLYYYNEIFPLKFDRKLH